MSQKIGISREAYQELDFICSQSGTSVDSLQMGIKSLTAAMDGAASGTKSNVEQFEKLGISVTNADGSLRSQEEVMWETMSALQGMENQTEKARLATELFGRSGTELMPLLNGASGSIDAMKQQAHDLGLVMSDEFVDDSVKFTDTIDQAKRSLNAAGMSIAGGFLPFVQKGIQKVVEFSPHISEMASVISEKLVSGLELVGDVASDIGEFWSEVLAPAFGAVSEALGTVWDSLQPVFDSLSELIPKADESKSLFDYFKDACWGLEDALLWVADKLTAVSDWITNHQALIEGLIIVIGSLATAWGLVNGAIILWNSIGVIASAVTTGLTAASTAFGAAVAFLTSPITLVVIAIGALIAIGVALYKNWDTIKEKVGKLKDDMVQKFNSIKEKVVGVFTKIKETISEKINSAKETVKSVIEKIKGFFKFDWSLPKLKMPHVNITGSFSLSPPSVPKFSIDWYKKAMDDPIIMNSPTAFGINKLGQIMAGGEAGSEVVSGTDTLMNMIQEAVANENSVIADKLDRLINFLFAILPQMLDNMGNDIVLDDGVLVGRMAPAMDAELGRIASRKERL